MPATAATTTGTAASRRPSTFRTLAVAAVEPITDDAVVITFAVPAELSAEFAFAPGQHLTLRCRLAGDDVRRNYSICSPVGGPLRVAVKRLAGGVFSTYACDSLRPGELIEVMPPSGRFTVTLVPGQARHYCAVAAGSGITPILSIVASVLETEPGTRVTLLYGNRTSGSVMFLEELADLKDRYLGRLALFHVLSRERQDADVLNGRIDAAKLGVLLATLVPPESVDEWFLCGPADMIETARATLLGHGVAATSVHRELFHVGPEAPRPVVEKAEAAAGTAEVTIVLDGRGSTFRLAQGGDSSILDAALAVRPDAPYACKNGMCGTCRAKVVEGSVAMDHNYALEEDELAAGFVLACQAHPLTESVTLDFDA